MKVLGPFIPAIWQQLFKHCECQEEGTRNVVSECLGKLCLIDPEKLLPELQAALSSPSPLMRTTVVTAMKFTISDQPQAIDSLLKNSIGEFLKTLEDPDLNVRRVALVAFNSAAHNKPMLVRDLLRTTLPHLYNETQVPMTTFLPASEVLVEETHHACTYRLEEMRVRFILFVFCRNARS